MSLNRRQFIAISSIALGAAPFRGWLSAQVPAVSPARFSAIRRNVGFLTAQGGTVGWLINKDGAIVVDTQYARSAPACVDLLKQHGAPSIDVVFNTHHHADHTGGNGVFQAVARKIVAQAKVPELQRKAAAEQPNPEPQVVANATFDKAWGEELGNERVTAVHYGPGHTAGDAVVTFDRANVVHLGDLVFHQLHPRIDRPGGASVQGWMERLSQIQKAGGRDTQYIVGHAKEGNPLVVGRAALQQQANYFDALLSHVRKGIAAGQSKTELTALKALPGFESYASLGQILTLEAAIGAAYEELIAR